MNSSPIKQLFKVLCVWCWGGLLVACNRDSEPAPTPAPAPAKASKSSAQKSENDPLAGMIMAVPADSRHQPFELRFELLTRPEIGQTVNVKFNLLAVEDATDVKLTASTGPKLVVAAGTEASYASLKAGESASHTVALRGAETGIFVVDMKVTATANGGPRTASYAVPVALVPAASAADAATSAAAGSK